MKKYLKFLIVPVVALFVFSGIHRGTTTNQYQTYDVQHSKIGAVMGWLSGKAPAYTVNHWGPQDACAGAADTSGPNNFGNGVANGCSTAVTMANGNILATMPCLANYHACQAWAAGAVTPVQGAGPLNCVITSVATQLATQSAPTATAFQVQVIAPTGNVNVTAQVMGVY